MKRVLILLAVFMFGFVLVACGNNNTTLSGVYGNLDRRENIWLDLADDGSFIKYTVYWNCPPDDEDVLCTRSNALNSVLEMTGFGQDVRQRMSTTSAVDGRQSAENDNFQVSWTYHPDEGLQVLFEHN